MKKRNDRGFTLVELVTVIVVIGILAVVAIPKFVSFSSESRVAIMEKLNDTINSANAMALTKSTLAGIKESNCLKPTDDTCKLIDAGKGNMVQLHGITNPVAAPDSLTPAYGVFPRDLPKVVSGLGDKQLTDLSPLGISWETIGQDSDFSYSYEEISESYRIMIFPKGKDTPDDLKKAILSPNTGCYLVYETKKTEFSYGVSTKLVLSEC